MKIYKKLTKAVFCATVLGGSYSFGCAGIGTAISHKDLKIKLNEQFYFLAANS